MPPKTHVYGNTRRGVSFRTDWRTFAGTDLTEHGGDQYLLELVRLFPLTPYLDEVVPFRKLFT